MDEMVNKFQVNRDAEEKELTIQYAIRMMEIELQIKDLKDDQKEIKKQAKDEGVMIGKVTKALSNMKAVLKAKPGEIKELNEMIELLNSNVDIKAHLQELVRED